MAFNIRFPMSFIIGRVVFFIRNSDGLKSDLLVIIVGVSVRGCVLTRPGRTTKESINNVIV